MGSMEKVTYAKMTSGFVGDGYMPVIFASIMLYISSAMTTSRHSLPRPSADTTSSIFRVPPKRRWTTEEVIRGARSTGEGRGRAYLSLAAQSRYSKGVLGARKSCTAATAPRSLLSGAPARRAQRDPHRQNTDCESISVTFAGLARAAY